MTTIYYNDNNNYKKCDIVTENTGYNVASYGVTLPRAYILTSLQCDDE